LGYPLFDGLGEFKWTGQTSFFVDVIMKHLPEWLRDEINSAFYHLLEAHQGREQTVFFFVKVALDHFPDWLMEEIRSNQYTIYDVGCALGDAVHVLAQASVSSFSC
jgi:hypothetical protein